MTGDAAGPGRLAWLAGAGAVAGAIIWPIAIANVAATAIPTGGPGEASDVEGSMGPLAIAVLLFSAALGALECRATSEIGLWDLIGDLSIATAAVTLALAAALGSSDLIGPGFVLLFGGSIIVGATGFAGTRRPRWPSALVAIGAGALVACLFLAGALGPAARDGVTQTAFLSVLFYAVGWGWFGVHLVLARPLASHPDEQP